MLSGLEWLALEAKYLDRAREFYTTHLDLDVLAERDREVVLAAGDDRLVLRAPSSVPRGGVHTHFAFAAPSAEYEGWRDRLAADFDLVEHDFGSARSLYFYDPDGNCVEIGESDESGDGITGIFEIVLEVEDVARAESLYRALGFEVVDRGSERRRVRLTGPVDIELWEPHLGIADARGGLHVDVGFTAERPSDVADTDAVADRVCRVERREDGIRLRDTDGHYLTVRG